MDLENSNFRSKNIAVTSFVIAIIVLIIVTVVSKLWVLLSIPIGLLFGFFLQRGDLCGSSAFSEVILMKDFHVYKKIREVFKKRKAKQFVVTKTWFVEAENTTEAIELTEQKPHNWLQVIPYMGNNNNEDK